jgi:hypothetical protein
MPRSNWQPEIEVRAWHPDTGQWVPVIPTPAEFDMLAKGPSIPLAMGKFEMKWPPEKQTFESVTAAETQERTKRRK